MKYFSVIRLLQSDVMGFTLRRDTDVFEDIAV
jgi:hypothetical protein